MGDNTLKRLIAFLSGAVGALLIYESWIIYTIFSKVFKLNLGRWEKALSKTCNNEVSTKESFPLDNSCLDFMHVIKDLVSWIYS